MEQMFTVRLVDMEQNAMEQSADVWAAISAMEQRFSAALVALQWEVQMEPRFSARLVVLQWQFHMEVQNLLRTLETVMVSEGCASTETVQACEGLASAHKVLACTGCATTGFTWLVRCAQKAIAEANMYEALALLQEPLQPRQIAKAYDTALTGGRAAARAVRLIRDLLVLKVCSVAGPWCNKTIVETMNIHFDREVEGTIVAQVLLAYNSMFRAATDKHEFKRTVSMFEEALDETTSQNLLAAYIVLHQTSPEFQSKAKAQGKARKAKLQPHKQLCLDLADLEMAQKDLSPSAPSNLLEHNGKTSADDTALANPLIFVLPSGY